MAIIATVLVVFSVYSTGTTQHIVTEKVSHILETKSKTALTYLLSSCAATVEKALQTTWTRPALPERFLKYCTPNRKKSTFANW